MYVVFDANAAELIFNERLNGRSIDGVGKGGGQFIVLPDGRYDVDAGFDGDGHTGREVSIQSQELVTEFGATLSTLRIAGQVAEVFHVVNVEAQQMPEPVWEKQCVRSARRKLGRVASQQVGLDQPLADDPTGQVVNVAETPARNTGRDRFALGSQNGVVEPALDGRELSTNGISSCDVGGVAAGLLGTGVDQQQPARRQRVGIAFAV